MTLRSDPVLDNLKTVDEQNNLVCNDTTYLGRLFLL